MSNLIDKIAWIEIQDRSILSTRSKGKEKWYIPGGKREPGETDIQTLCREIKEELSVEIDTSTVKYLGTFKAQADGKAEGVIVQMTCYTGNYAGSLKCSAEIAEKDWLGMSDFDRIAPVDKIIFNWLNKQGLIQ